MTAALALFLLAGPLWAGSARLQLPKGAAKAEDSLRLWLGRQDSLRRTVDEAAQSAAPALVEDGLKDALADAPAGREALLERLPGLRRPRTPVCRSLSDCAVPPLALDVEAEEPVEPAVRELLRPWLWLAQARGQRMKVSAAPAGDRRLLEFSIPKLGIKSATVSVAPRPLGGVRLRIDRGLELAEVYSRERAAAER
ncbi:MAG: hypothetical protein PHF00_04900 [Elusimicrobia bacterium]|nr:hypothetical protein [Elusimicrobiota bacterium]